MQLVSDSTIATKDKDNGIGWMIFNNPERRNASDAAEICEALIRPTMRSAPLKSAEQQSVLMLHRARELLVRQRTMLINALRGHCGELGIVVAQGASKLAGLIGMIEDPEDERLPERISGHRITDGNMNLIARVMMM